VNKLLIIILCNFLYQNLFAQNKIGIDTAILVCKDNQIYENRKILIDLQNNKFILIKFKGNLDLGTFHLSTRPSITANSFERALGIALIKYDSNDKLVWAKKLAESDSTYDSKIFFDEYNNIYISYHFLTKLYYDNDSLVTSQGQSNFNIFKYDSSANLIKKKCLPGYASVLAATATSNNNFYISGVHGIGLNYQYQLDNFNLTSTNSDFYIAKMDTALNILNVKNYGGYGVDGAYHIKLYNNSIYIMGGIYQGNSINIGGITVNYSTGYSSKSFIAKLDTLGNAQWVRKFGDNNILPSYFPSAFDVSQDRVFIGGYGGANNPNKFLFEGGPTLLGAGFWDYFIAAYDTSGNFKWNKISKGSGNAHLMEIDTDTDGNMYAIGTTTYKLSFPTDTIIGQGGEDVFVCSYDSVGKFRYATICGGTGLDIAGGIALDTNNKPYIVGGTNSFTSGCIFGNDTLYTPANQSTLFFASIDSIKKITPVSISKVNVSKKLISISPNPSQTSCVIEINNGKGEIQVLNSIGEIITTQVLINGKATIITENMPNGLYFIQHKNKEEYQIQKLLINH
jgi:hypothetical protein